METEYNLEKNPERKYNSRKPGRLVTAVAGLAMIVGGAGTYLGIAGCDKQQDTKKDKPTAAKNEYSLGGFESTLGTRWFVSSEEYKQKVRKEWYVLSEDEKRTIYNIYSDPNEFYNSLSSEDREKFDKFSLSNLTELEIQKYGKEMPWLDTENPSRSDMLLLYVAVSIRDLINARGSN